MKRRPPLLSPDVHQVDCHRGSRCSPGELLPQAKPTHSNPGGYIWNKADHSSQPNQWDNSNWERSQRASFDPSQPHGDVYQPWNFSNHKSGLPDGCARTRPGSHHTGGHRGTGWHGGIRQRRVRRDHQAQHLHRLPHPRICNHHQPHRGCHVGDDVPGGGCQAGTCDGLPLRRDGYIGIRDLGDRGCG